MQQNRLFRSNSLRLMGLLVMSLISLDHGAQAATSTSQQAIVLELFTSQGCSSCPPADALLKQTSSGDPSLLALSFHVHYWDYLGWKDPFSSTANTERQKAYAAHLSGGLYTPELIVDGTKAVVGSQPNAVSKAITEAKTNGAKATVLISDNPVGQLMVAVTPGSVNPADFPADVYEVTFNRSSRTFVENGENSGHTIENINNVLSINKLGIAGSPKTSFDIQKPDLSTEGVAIIVQKPNTGIILGAAYL
jgi:hypothetical protein